MAGGYDAYGQVHSQNLKGRALEAEAFMKAVQLLTRAQDFPENKRLLGESLQYVQKLWMIVKADLEAPRNKLPKETQQHLLSLAEMVDAQCRAAIKKPPEHRLQGLIEIHRNVAAGLMS